jgi:hypothetical protein
MNISALHDSQSPENRNTIQPCYTNVTTVLGRTPEKSAFDSQQRPGHRLQGPPSLRSSVYQGLVSRG